MTSRVAKKPIPVPTGVQVKLTGQDINIKGKHGELKYSAHQDVKLIFENNIINVATSDNNANSDNLAGSTRAIVSNMVTGVHDGFQRKLVLIGVGYRAKAQGKVLNLNLGFSHPVDMTMPEGITVDTPSQTEITIKGSDKQLVSQVAANIRAVRPVEPYKGKGVRYENEKITLKEAKKK